MTDLFGEVNATSHTLLNLTVEEVGELSPAERIERVVLLEQDAERIMREAKAQHLASHRLAATCVLYSGGNDSTTLAHLALRLWQPDYAVHINTGIGIEQTREFVRETCAAWDLPLLEEHPPIGSTYREIVLDQGFPGPGHHFKMYQRLKERGLRTVRRNLVKDGRAERIIFLAGRRRQESKRRAGVPEYEREGSVVWVSPIANWHKLDLSTYRQIHDLPRNEVSDLLHMSGECLCGAFAKPGELDEIGMWFPEVKAEIESLEAEVAASGRIPEKRCRWGWGNGEKGGASKSGPMCSSCDARFQPLTIDDALAEVGA